MESLSKQELISTITKQADQIKRYEGRLRDVVAAYKGLIKEKEALEISLKALNKTETPVEGEENRDDSVAALMLSLSTLTAEKSRMEEAFQADKKLTRDKYENQIAAMREETKTLVQQHFAEINNLKAKVAYEIQEREKERADHQAMMKELHLKLNSERKTKERLEDKVVHSSEAHAVSQTELEKRVRDLSSSLSAAQRRLQRAEARTVETPALLVRLQHKLALLEQSHALAIREEQIKAKRAEESARKVCARQEERVALLESKLAELSETVGRYDLRRRHDLQLIQQLKDSLNGRLMDKITANNDYDAAEAQQKSETDNEKLADSEYLQTLIDKIHILKKELIAENDKLGSPIDISSVFKVQGYENIHLKCREEYESLKLEYEMYKQQTKVREVGDNVESDVGDLKSEIAVLIEKVETYKMMLEEERQDKLDTLKLYEEKMKNEQDYHSEVVSELKTRVQSLEKQVHTQRERYAALLDEADNYIRARNDRRASADENNYKDGMLTDVSAPPHMLHYAHELARKDLDISQLRKEKHIMEGQFRDCQRDATIEKERFKEVIRTLKEEIDRLRRIQSREGANLEYLKNVVMAYLMSTDYAGRKHMLNAIAAVLHFTANEKNQVLTNL
ncbi:GRIP and coiled-coil domain-containing protein 1 isoform X3 [Trichoplusia ni]|uniref:GRIP and coiled-coil domain-containing protein 1 isoform X3 n=1 Tax=Trichoplusia ni TaxID=7111 RepID=A0A7E5VWF6_TRINI|nr:GRIP and coiled-coil domain-containing protein 1 isoform X3 [Trichoplusia ni]